MTEQKSQTFHVEGMTCASCVFFIEETLPGNAGVQTTRVDLRTCTAIVSGDFVDDPVTLAQKLTGLVEGHGYRLLLEKVETKKSHREFFIAERLSLLRSRRRDICPPAAISGTSMDRDRAHVSSGAAWACGGNSGASHARFRTWLLIQSLSSSSSQAASVPKVEEMCYG